MSQTKEFAKLFSTTIAYVRNEIGNLQEELVDAVKNRHDQIEESLIKKLNDLVSDLETKKSELHEEVKKEALETITLVLRSQLSEQIKENIPSDIVHQAGFEFLERTVHSLGESLRDQITDIKSEHTKNITQLNETIDRDSTNQRSINEELEKETKDVIKQTQKNTKDIQGLSGDFVKHEEYVKKELTKLSDFLETQRKKTKELITKTEEDFALSLDELKRQIVKDVETISRGVSQRVVHVENQQLMFGKEFDQKLVDLNQTLTDLLQNKSNDNHTHSEFAGFSSKDHTHREFQAFSLKSHDHKEFLLLEKKISTVEKNILKKADVKEITDEAIKKIKISQPKDGEDGKNGKDGKNWEFKFHPNQRGLLLYKREDWKDWKTEDLLGPTRQVGNPNDLMGYGGGGAESAGFLHDGNTTTFLDLRVAIGRTFTDSNGMFEFDTSRIPFRQILSATASCPLLPNVALTLEERTIDAYVDEISGDLITGIAVRTRAAIALLGTELKIRDCAEAGIPVTITVIGY